MSSDNLPVPETLPPFPEPPSEPVVPSAEMPQAATPESEEVADTVPSETPSTTALPAPVTDSEKVAAAPELPGDAAVPESLEESEESLGTVLEQPWVEAVTEEPVEGLNQEIIGSCQEGSRQEGLRQEIETLEQRKAQLSQEVTVLEDQRTQLRIQVTETQEALKQVIKEGLQELRERRQALKLSVEQLERRQERVREEMRQSFAGASQELAVRVQSFKEFLVGSLQDLVSSAEDLNLVPMTEAQPMEAAPPQSKGTARPPRFAEQSFQEEARDIQRLLDQYRNAPDYYGPPWQLRRTFEPIHAERVADWFFQQGGRGAVRSMNSRLQNILIASAVISILNDFYGEQLSTLVLANSPERLGEWRRGLQDCLGISRSDFGPNQGIALFEDPEPIVQRADRMLRAGDLPLIIIDETEEFISLDLLQFPLWLAFAMDSEQDRIQTESNRDWGAGQRNRDQDWGSSQKNPDRDWESGQRNRNRN
jgi:hypothetical protein